MEMEWVGGGGLVPDSPRQPTFTSIQTSLPLSTHEKVNPRFTVEGIGHLNKNNNNKKKKKNSDDNYLSLP